MSLKGNTKIRSKKDNILTRNSNSIIAACVTACIMLFVYAVWEFFPVGDNIILRMDLYHQYAPLFAEFLERVKGGASLLYSFTSGMGSGFLGNFFNYLSSPAALLVFIFGHKNIPEAIAGMVLIKATVSAYAFSYFIQKINNKKNYASIGFGILYAFCGYFIAYYWNIMWLDAMAIFPLVILGIYYIIEKGNGLMYTLSLAYIMLTNYYMAYMTCILSVIFFIYLFIIGNDFGTKLYPGAVFKDKYKKSLAVKLKNNKFWRRGLLFAGCSILAAMIAAVALLPVYSALQTSSATGSSFPSSFSTYFKFFDFLANHLAGATPTIRSSGNTVLPNVYCGVLTLILIPLFIFNDKFSLKEKISTTTVLGIFFLSFNINYLNFIWHGFHFPNDLPYRFSFAYSFFLLFVAYRVLMNLDSISSKQIVASSLGVSLFAIIAEKVESVNVNMTVVWITIIYAIGYAIILTCVKNKKHARQALTVVLVATIVSEVLIADTNNYKVTQTKDSYTSSYDDTEAAVQSIKDNDDPSKTFYRMELAQLLTRMDNCWFYYNGVSTFTSMAYEKVANLQKSLGLYGNKINSYTYNPQTALYNSMMSLKYIVDNHSYVATDNYIPRMDDNFIYSKVSTYNNMTTYQNNYWLPVAFSANESLVDSWNYDSENPFEVQNDFYYNATGVKDILVPIEGKAVSNENLEEFSDDDVKSGSLNLIKVDMKSKNGVASLKYTVPEDEVVYVYVSGSDINSAFVYATGFSYNQTVDVEPYVLDLGYMEKGTEISVDISLKEDATNSSCNVFCVGLDKDKFIESYNDIKTGGELEVTKNTESDILGTIDLSEGKMLYTSIPYDSSWCVYVDGKKLDSENIVRIGDALLGVKMDAGHHEVEFKYVSPSLIVGAFITIIGLLLLVVIEILKKKKKAMFSEKHIHEKGELYKYRDADIEQKIANGEIDALSIEEPNKDTEAEKMADDNEKRPDDELDLEQLMDDFKSTYINDDAPTSTDEKTVDEVDETTADDDVVQVAVSSDELDSFAKATENFVDEKNQDEATDETPLNDEDTGKKKR